MQLLLLYKLQILILSKKIWPKIKWKNINIESFSESKPLSLNSNKAKKNLKWRDVFSSEEKIKLTLEWYKKYYNTNTRNIIQNMFKDDLEKYGYQF
mgnify:CR=1 FL=1